MEGPWAIAGTIVGVLVLALTGWQIVVTPIWRRWRLKKPCRAYFVIESLKQRNMSYAVQDDKVHYVEELTLPANSEAEIEILYESSVPFVASQIYFGCGEQNDLEVDSKPIIDSYFTYFVERGTTEETPETHPDHNYTDRNKFYHIRKSQNVAVGETYLLGFKIKTRRAGKYRARLFFMGEKTGTTQNDLFIRVEDKPATKMKCVLRAHRWDGCFVSPQARRSEALPAD